MAPRGHVICLWLLSQQVVELGSKLSFLVSKLSLLSSIAPHYALVGPSRLLLGLLTNLLCDLWTQASLVSASLTIVTLMVCSFQCQRAKGSSVYRNILKLVRFQGIMKRDYWVTNRLCQADPWQMLRIHPENSNL